MYNTEDKIEQCLSSLQKQDYHNIEIILIDDGSTDRSLDICKKIAKNDARIKIITKENAGVAAARIDGLKISKGEYIMGPLSRPRSKILRVAVSRIILSSEASKVKLVGNLVA